MCCSGHGIAGYCQEGEGVCANDGDCQGSLACGKANCPWGGGRCCAGRCLTKANKTCDFPFTHENITYDKCTWAGASRPWCAIQVDNNRAPLDWSFCLPECSVSDLKCDSTDANEFPEYCIFPFVYRGTTHEKCTSEGWHTAWCSTQNDDNNMTLQWRNCESECIVRCDGILHFANRSDEAGCINGRGGSDSEVIYDRGFDTDNLKERLRRQPKITKEQIATITKRGLDKECSTSDFHMMVEEKAGNESLLKFSTARPRGITIGNTCYNLSELCKEIPGVNFLSEHGDATLFDFYSSDHILLCQNYTFWSHLSNLDIVNKTICTGNFPGFSRTSSKSCKIVPQCPDLSDIVCQTSECKPGVHFSCKDNQTCIHNSLRCDGHEQCPDGSDEDFEYCSNCPLWEGKGHPPRLPSEEFANTFSCTHRYTGKPICAIRCDGRDDLCAQFEDELNCEACLFLCDKISLSYQILLIVILAEIFLTTIFRCAEKGILLPKCFKNIFWSFDPKPSLVPIPMHSLNEINPRDDYSYQRQRPAHFLQIDIIQAKCLDCPNSRQKLCRAQYDLELKYNSDDEYATDMFYFEKLETCDLSDTFFDNVDNALFSVRLVKWLAQKFQTICGFFRKVLQMIVVKTILFLIHLLFYYIDFFKDVMLLATLYSFLPDKGSADKARLPIGLFSLSLGSILLAEIANIIVVANFKSWSKKKRFIASLFIFLVPAVIIYRIHRLELLFLNYVKKGASREQIIKTRLQLKELKTLQAKLRTNENVLEHLPQLSVIVVLMLIKASSTITESAHLSNNLLRGSDFILISSATISLLSLVRGQLNLTILKKNGFVPLLGKAILILYYATGTVARVFAIVLFFTPSIGLMDTLHHLRLGQLPAYGFGNSTHFNATHSNFWNLHYKLDKPEDFYYFPKEAVYCIMILTPILHMMLSMLLQRKIYYRGASSPQVMEGICTLVCPPVHLDWELLFRLKGGDTISDCWKRSKYLFLAYNILLLIEHLVLLMPIMVLKLAIDKRNDNLAQYFPQTVDEELSTLRVNSLFYGGLAGFTILPIISCGLAYAYFTRKHAWSRILNPAKKKE